MSIPSRYRLVIALLALFCQAVCYAQQNRIDSLKKVLPRLNGAAQVDCLNGLSEAYRAIRVFHASRTFALEAVFDADKITYTAGDGQAYYNLAATGSEVRDFAAVEKDCDTSISFFQKMNAKKQLAKSYILLGQTIWAQSKFDKAKEAFNKANQIYIQSGDSTHSATTYSLVALLEEERGNYEQSFQYAMKALKFDNEGAFTALGQLYADVGDYETALDYYAKIRTRNFKVYSYLKVGEAYYLQKKYDSAMYYYRLHIKEGGGISNNLLPKPYALLGSVYLDLKKYDTALYYLNAALKDFRAERNGNWTMRVLLELGKTYREMGNVNAAMANTRELLVAAEQSGARQYILDANFLLFELYDGLQQKDSAYVHLKKYTALNHEIDLDFSARKLAFYKTSHEREQAQLKIDLLSKQRQLQQQELKQTSQQRKFLFIGLLVLALLGFVLVRNILLKKRNESHRRELAENDLRIQKLESKKQLGELEMQVLRTQMNPHFIFNSLNSINRFILRSNKTQASEYLTKFSRLVRMILQNSQNKLITLEQELESLELYLSLEALRFDDHFSYQVAVQDDLDVSLLKVPPLIIQPYAENSVWHGLMHKEEKGHLHIEVLSENGLLCIKITDDGVGRKKATRLAAKPSTNHRSMGLGITSQRIEMIQEPTSQEPAVVINDLVDADANPCGTEVVIKLPVIYD